MSSKRRSLFFSFFNFTPNFLQAGAKCISFGYVNSLSSRFFPLTDSQNITCAILAAGASSGHHQVHPRCTGGGDGRRCQGRQGEKLFPPMTRLKRSGSPQISSTSTILAIFCPHVNFNLDFIFVKLENCQRHFMRPMHLLRFCWRSRHSPDTSDWEDGID